jgi:hypothetical protein
MTQDLMPHESEPTGDDGFAGSLNEHLFRSNNFLRWTDAAGWMDRDGLPPPSPMLVLAVDTGLQRWIDNRPELTRDKPLPDPDELNTKIPKSTWQKGPDGNPQPPWKHVVIFCCVDAKTGRSYKYTADTVGGHIAYDELKESVILMRALRGAAVCPLVNLTEKPWKTTHGLRKRPYFHIIGWKLPGEAKTVPAKSTPQLPAPTTVPEGAPPTQPATSPPRVSTTQAPTPPPATVAPFEARSKPAVNLTDETLAAMGDVAPVSIGEALDDELPF